MKLPQNAFLVILLFAPICLIGQVQNNGNLRMHQGSEIGLFGDFSNEGTFINNLGTLHAVGPEAQTFKGNNPIQANNFTINKSDNALQVDNVFQIAREITFTNGLILTDREDIETEFVDFLDGASHVGASNTSHIDGVIRKTGNKSFIFPTGDNAILRTIGISAPDNVDDHFTAYYVENNPNGLYSRASLDVGIDHVSGCEYWILNQTGGNSNVEVTLSWDSNSCGVENLCDLLVTRWDGTQWTSEGNGGVAGTVDSGTLVSGMDCSVPATVTNFSPFTLGSTTTFNILPIALISFNANLCQNSVCLTWQTASEKNNDFFIVEKSANGLNWEDFEKIEGAGNSEVILNYAIIDRNPYSGYTYFRLKQTDFDGGINYSSVEAIYLENPIHKGLTIYPNPASDNITIKGIQSGANQLIIYNMLGREVTPLTKTIAKNDDMVHLDVSLLTPGVYQIRMMYSYSSFIKQ